MNEVLVQAHDLDEALIVAHQLHGERPRPCNAFGIQSRKSR